MIITIFVILFLGLMAMNCFLYWVGGDYPGRGEVFLYMTLLAVVIAAIGSIFVVS